MHPLRQPASPTDKHSNHLPDSTTLCAPHSLIDTMSLSRFFYEPFYTLSDFDRLFDEAFNARTSGNGSSNSQQVQRQEGTTSRALRPR